MHFGGFKSSKIRSVLSVRRSRRPQTRLETSCTRTGRPRRHLPPTQTAVGGRRRSRAARAYVTEDSHGGIVPMNHSNKTADRWRRLEEARPLIKQLRVRRCALATHSVVASGQFHICDSITPSFDVQQINRFWSELDSIGKG
jgi:hypothetical protein